MLLSIDNDVLMFIQEHIRCGFLDLIFPNITHLGDKGLAWIALTILLLFFKKTRKAGIYSACALVLSLIINNEIIKPLVARTRPYDLKELKDRGFVIWKVAKETDAGSFPSGHAAASFASAVAMCKNLPKKWMSVTVIAVAFLIAISRLYVGVHFPTDVICGILSGTIIGTVVNIVGNKIYGKVTANKQEKEENA